MRISVAEIEQALRDQYPHGHPKFIPHLLELIKLHSDKNHDYAHGDGPLSNFTRVADWFKHFPNLRLSSPPVYALALAMKQVDSVCNYLDKQHTAKVEGLTPRADDVSVYFQLIALLAAEIEIQLKKT